MNDAAFVNAFFAKTADGVATDACVAATVATAVDPKVPPWKLELINRRRTRNNNNQLTKCGGGGGGCSNEQQQPQQQQQQQQAKPVQWTWPSSTPSTQHFLQQPQPDAAAQVTSTTPPPPQQQQQQQPSPPSQPTVVVGTTTVCSAGMRLFKCEATIMTNFKKNPAPVVANGGARARSKFKTKPQIITEITNGLDYRSDSSGEEFKYGPGIVNKLKSKYMSMTVREQRPRPALRRSTSMDNIVEDAAGRGKRNDSAATAGAAAEPHRKGQLQHHHAHVQHHRPGQQYHQLLLGGGACKRYAQPDVIICGAAAVAAAAAKRSSDTMKRARSMETLSCGGVGPAVDDEQPTNAGELPPPDVVKTYKKIFETKTTGADDAVAVVKSASPVKIKPIIMPKPTTIVSPVVDKTRPARTNKAPLKKATPPIKYPNRLKKKETLGFDRSKSLINDEVSSSQDESSMSSDDGGSARHRVAIKTAITATTIDNKPISVQTKQICVIRPTTRTTIQLQSEETTNAQLSDKEIEKNFINNNNNSNNTNNVNNTSVNTVNNTIVNNINTINNVNNTNNVDNNTNGEKRIGGLWDKKRWDNHENSVVFNFVNRKGVPNYIDSEGPLQRRDNSYGIKDGCIMLDSHCEESSTDDIDTVNKENYVIFVGDNIIIGRSNLRKENTSTTKKDLRIKFSEVLETMHEYPSEASLLTEDESTRREHEDDVNDIDGDSTPAPQKSKFGNYVPSKLGADEEAFLGEYGVSRSANVQKTATKRADKSEENVTDLSMMDTNVPWSEETTPDLLF